MIKQRSATALRRQEKKNRCETTRIGVQSRHTSYPLKTTYDMSRLAKEFVEEIVRLHSVPVSIISDRDLHVTSRFWHCL
jgi:hypothetical protein